MACMDAYTQRHVMKKKTKTVATWIANEAHMSRAAWVRSPAATAFAQYNASICDTMCPTKHAEVPSPPQYRVFHLDSDVKMPPTTKINWHFMQHM